MPLKLAIKLLRKLYAAGLISKHAMMSPKKAAFSFLSWINKGYYLGKPQAIQVGLSDTMKYAEKILISKGLPVTRNSLKKVLDDIISKGKMISLEGKRAEIAIINKSKSFSPNIVKRKIKLHRDVIDLEKASEPYARTLRVSNPYNKKSMKYYNLKVGTPKEVGIPKYKWGMLNLKPDSKVQHLIINNKAGYGKEWLKDLRRKSIMDPRLRDILGEKAVSKASVTPGMKITGPTKSHVSFTPAYKGFKRGQDPNKLYPNKGDKVVAGFNTSADFTKAMWRPKLQFYDKTDWKRGGLIDKVLDKYIDNVVISGKSIV